MKTAVSENCCKAEFFVATVVGEADSGQMLNKQRKKLREHKLHEHKVVKHRTSVDAVSTTIAGLEVVNDDVAEVIMVKGANIDGTKSEDRMSHEQLHGIAVGLLASGSISEAAAMRQARPFVFAAMAMWNGSGSMWDNTHAPLHVAPVVHLRKKVYGEVKSPAIESAERNDVGCSEGKRESLTALIDRWIAIKRNSGREPDASVHEKLWALSERFLPGGESAIIVGEDMNAVDACGGQNTLRLLGPSLDVDGRRMHGGDEVVSAPSWMVSAPCYERLRARAVKRFDPSAYLKHLTELLSATTQQKVTVMFDTPAAHPVTATLMWEATGTLLSPSNNKNNNKGFVVRLDEEVALLAKSGLLAVRDIAVADASAPWNSGVFVYGQSWPGFRFSKHSLLADKSLRVMLPRSASPELWWPTPDLVTVFNSLPTSMTGSLKAAEFDTFKRLVESSVAIAEKLATSGEEDADSGAADSPVIHAMGEWRHGAFSKQYTFLQNVRTFNRDVAQYIGARLATLRKLANSKQAGGGGVVHDDNDGSCVPFAVRNKEDGRLELTWRQLVNGSFRHATFDVGGAAVASSVQGYLTASDVAHTRSGLTSFGESMRYDHLRVFDAPCITRMAASLRAASSLNAESAARAAVKFYNLGDDGRQAIAEVNLNRIRIWATHRRLSLRTTSKTTLIATTTTTPIGYDDADEFILSIADVAHYKRFTVPEPASLSTSASTAPKHLLAAFVDVLGDDVDLSAGERRAVLDNYEFYMQNVQATLERNILDVKRRRSELMNRANLRGDAYDAFERQLIERLRARSETERILDGVVVMAALLLLLPGPTQAAPHVMLQTKVIDAATEVLSAHGESYRPPELRRSNGIKNNNQNDSKIRGGSKTTTKKPETQAHQWLTEAILSRRQAIALEKPLGAVIPSRANSILATDDGAADTDESSGKGHHHLAWPRFRPVMGRVDQHRVSSTVNRRASSRLAARHATTKLISALGDHVQAQNALMLGFNLKPLRNVNACCIRPVDTDGWSDLLAAAGGKIKAMHLGVMKAPLDEDRDVVLGLAHATHCISDNPPVVVVSESTAAATTTIAVADPMTVETMATGVDKAAVKRISGEEGLVNLARAVVSGLLAADPVMPSVAKSARWDDLEAPYASAFRTLAGDVGLDDTATNELVARYVQGGQPAGDVLRDLRSFMRADLAPAIRRAAGIDTNGGGMGGDVQLRELVYRISSHLPAMEAADAITAITSVARHFAPILQASSVPASSGTERSWVLLTGHACVGALRALTGAAPTGSRLAPVLASIAGLVLRRWANKLHFNRSDTRDEDERAIKDEREAVKRERRRLDELMSDEAKELQRELKAVGLVAAGDALRHSLDDDGVGGVVSNNEDKPPVPAGEEDARDYYWSAGDDGDDGDHADALVDGDIGDGAGD